jgi:hypothetical protein
MFGVPIKTRLPLEAWAVAAVLTFILTLSSLIEGPAVSVAIDTPRSLEQSADLVKASFVGDHYTPHRGEGLSQGLSE